MKTITVTALRKDIYSSLDGVLETGIPLEVERKGKKILIISAERVNKFDLLTPHDCIVGDADELVDVETSLWQEQENL